MTFSMVNDPHKPRTLCPDCGLFWYFRIVFDNLAVDYVIWTAQKPFAMQFYYHIRHVSANMFAYVLMCVGFFSCVCTATNVYLCNVYFYWMLSIPFLSRDGECRSLSFVRIVITNLDRVLQCIRIKSMELRSFVNNSPNIVVTWAAIQCYGGDDAAFTAWEFVIELLVRTIIGPF